MQVLAESTYGGRTRALAYDRGLRPMTPGELSDALVEDKFVTGYRRVASTDVGGLFHVSTIWLGIDHNWTLDGPPVVFETMIFPALDGWPRGCDELMWRHVDEAHAHLGHSDAVRLARWWWLRGHLILWAIIAASFVTATVLD